MAKSKKPLDPAPTSHLCFWANIQEYCSQPDLHTCCAYCPSKDCLSRCTDNPSSCPYSCSQADLDKIGSQTIIPIEQPKEKRKYNKKAPAISKDDIEAYKQKKLNSLKGD